MKARARCASVPWELMLQEGAREGEGEGVGGESNNMLMPAMQQGLQLLHVSRNTQLRLKLKLQGAVHCFLA